MVAEFLTRVTGASILAAGGWGIGGYIADVWGPEQWVIWVYGLASTGAVLGLLSTPRLLSVLLSRAADRTRNIPTSRLLSGIVGLVAGLLVALLISVPLGRVPGPLTGVILPITLSLLLPYLGAAILFTPERDIFSRYILDTRDTRSHAGVAISPSLRNGFYTERILLDTSAIIDGRVAAISKTGFLYGTIVIPRFILDELRHVAGSRDSIRRNRGRRGLEMLNELRENDSVPIEVLEIDYPQASEVDGKLVGLAKEMGAAILTTDFNLNSVAQIEGISVLNVNELVNSLKPIVIPGESMRLNIIHEGKESGQGVGYLDDGTMVVVDSGSQFMDTELEVTVARVLQTVAGCIIFANPR